MLKLNTYQLQVSIDELLRPEKSVSIFYTTILNLDVIFPQKDEPNRNTKSGDFERSIQ